MALYKVACSNIGHLLYIHVLIKTTFKIAIFPANIGGIWHTQITLGLPGPRAMSSLPRLKLIQPGIQRTQNWKGWANKSKVPNYLHKMKASSAILYPTDLSYTKSELG